MGSLFEDGMGERLSISNGGKSQKQHDLKRFQLVIQFDHPMVDHHVQIGKRER